MKIFRTIILGASLALIAGFFNSCAPRVVVRGAAPAPAVVVRPAAKPAVVVKPRRTCRRVVVAPRRARCRR